MKKILVVDDDEGVLMLLNAILERANYYVTPAENGKKALELLKKDDYQVVVTDIVMPEMDGVALLREVKKHNPDIQVILTTGFAQIDTAISAVKEGAFSYIKKPYDPDSLLLEVKNAFEKYKLISELKKSYEYNETIIKHLTYTLIGLDENGNIKKINHVTEKLLGYTENEIIGKPFTSLLASDTDGFELDKWFSDTHLTDFPLNLRAKSGQIIPVFFTGTVMKNTEGRVIGFLGTLKHHLRKDEGAER